MWKTKALGRRSRLLNSHEVVVQSISETTARAGLTVYTKLDTGAYPTDGKVSDAELNAVPMTRHAFVGPAEALGCFCQPSRDNRHRPAATTLSRLRNRPLSLAADVAAGNGGGPK